MAEAIKRGESTHELRAARILCAIATVAYPTFWFADRIAGGFVQDPLWVRGLVTLGIVGVWVGTYASAHVRERLPTYLLAVVYTITTHNMVLLALNQLAPIFVTGALVVISGFIATASHTIRNRRQLVAYLGYVLLLTVGAVLFAQEPSTDPAYVLLSISTVGSLAFISVEAQRLIAERLAESEGRANALLNAVPDVMLRVGRDGSVQEVRNAATSALGNLAQRLLGGSIDALLNVDPETVGTAVRDVLCTQGSMLLEGEVVEGQRLFHIQMRVTPMDTNEALVLLRDVSQEKAMEERLRIADRVVSLGTLASGVAHEINNPLSYVINNVEYAREELTKHGGDLQAPDRAGILTALDEAHEGGDRIRQIVSDLRTQTTDVDEPLAPTDVEQTIRTALRMLDNQLRHRAKVELDFENVPPVQAASSRLLQVLINVLANAVHALRHVAPDEATIHVRTRPCEAECAVVEIEDSGEGISREQLARIFDPFYSTKAPGVGTGLGLYLCHQIITSFGGSITVSSKEGQGTTVRLEIPAAKHVKAAKPAVAQAEPIPIEGVLIVDDDQPVGRSLARLLRDHRPTVVSSGEEALAACRAGAYDLILCDVMMPEMDGPSFYEQLRELHPELVGRVVFMTGGAFTERTQEFLASVPNASVEKPLSRSTLLAAAREQLSRQPSSPP